jgi:hypothetical protein
MFSQQAGKIFVPTDSYAQSVCAKGCLHASGGMVNWVLICIGPELFFRTAHHQ